MNWLLHRLWPRSPAEWVRMTAACCIIAVIVATGVTWAQAWRAKRAFAVVPVERYHVPVPPNTTLRGLPPQSFAVGREVPAAAWTADQSDLSLEFLTQWYRRELTTGDWRLRRDDSRIGDFNVETLVSHNAARACTLEVRLSRSDIKHNRTHIVILAYPDLDSQGRPVQPGFALPGAGL